jgi:hypothetical protein
MCKGDMQCIFQVSVLVSHIYAEDARFPNKYSQSMFRSSHFFIQHFLYSSLNLIVF